LEDEIAGSKEDIERNLGIECKYISWPYGRMTDSDEISLDCARRAGYSACFGGFRGTIRANVTDRFQVPRRHFEVQWPFAHTEYFARGHFEDNYRDAKSELS
jgi:hypothetical protein